MYTIMYTPHTDEQICPGVNSDGQESIIAMKAVETAPVFA